MIICRYFQQKCAPLTDYYDDDLTTDGDQNLKKVTFQIKDQMDELLEIVRHGQVENRALEMVSWLFSDQ